MASLHLARPRASSFFRACQSCHCNAVNNSTGGTGVIGKRPSSHKAMMYPPGPSSVDNCMPRLSWNRASYCRPFHSTCHFQKDINDHQSSGGAPQNDDDNVGASIMSHDVSDADEVSVGLDVVDDQARLGESFTDIPGATNTKGKKLAIIYTCTVCDTRSAKQFTEHSYKNGVVLVRCPGCQNLHLIADNLGWFEDDGDEDYYGDGQGWNVEKVMAKAGGNAKVVTGDDVLELTLDDFMGKKT